VGQHAANASSKQKRVFQSSFDIEFQPFIFLDACNGLNMSDVIAKRRIFSEVRSVKFKGQNVNVIHEGT